jgi:hypothetical protein
MLPVIYAVPRATRAAAYGLDLTSGVDAAREVIRSAESTAMIMSPVTKLLVEDSMLGFVVFIPVYKPAKSGRGPAEDHDLRGCLVGIFRLDDFFPAPHPRA